MSDGGATQPPQASGDPATGAGAVGLVDMHCHLLPGVDDGCRDVRESIELARRLAAAGFTHAICTPHVAPEFPGNVPRDTPRAVAALQAELNGAGVPLTLLAGGENRLSEDIPLTPVNDLVLLCGGRSVGGYYYLFDTWDAAWPEHLERTVNWLHNRRITPIMAHPERCPFVCENPLFVADRLGEIGVLLQLNCYILAGEAAEKKGLFTREMRRCAERLIEFDHYSFVATDAHRADGLDERLEGMERAREYLGDKVFDRLARRNPSQLLPG